MTGRRCENKSQYITSSVSLTCAAAHNTSFGQSRKLYDKTDGCTAASGKLFRNTSFELLLIVKMLSCNGSYVLPASASVPTSVWVHTSH